MLFRSGSIAHLQIGSDLTPSQAKEIIMQSVEAGCEHFALNAVYIECQECGKVHKGKFTKCPACGSEKLNFFSRIIGYFSKVNNWSKDRREHDWPNRKFTSQDALNTQL